MAVDWSDPTQVQQARAEALAKGFAPSEVDSFIAQNSSQGKPPVTPQDPNPMVLPTAKPVKAADPSQDPNNMPIVTPATMQMPKPAEKAPEAPKVDPLAPLPAGALNGMPAPQPSQAPGQPAQPPMPTKQVLPQGQPQPQIQQTQPLQQGQQNGILPTQARITQHAGNYNPNVEIYSHGYARDTNFAVPIGTPTALPPGDWKVDKVYGAARPQGGPRGENQGYGNMVKVVNQQTGDSMIYQHLAQANAQPGQMLKGGAVIGKSGASGNVTGANLGIEYADAHGRIKDIANSPYSNSLFGGGQR